LNPTELNRRELANFPLPPQRDTDKDNHGKLLIVAGSRQVPGAALLSGQAALRSGAGKVRIATAASVAAGVALLMPEILIVPIEEAENGEFAGSCVAELGRQIDGMDAVVAGPGVRKGEIGIEIARMLLKAGKPVAFDAGLLHCLGAVASECHEADVPPILLPHAGELAALLSCNEDEVAADRLGAAREAAELYGAFVLAKGATSFIAAPDGRSWVWHGGVPGLGIAGSGDVLAGIVGALLARGAEPLTALLWSVLLHGEAGEVLSSKIGPIGFLARELPDELPALLAR
jgi:hydroxyethylthiazole kinase-like uncharacterized protein yjeF